MDGDDWAEYMTVEEDKHSDANNGADDSRMPPSHRIRWCPDLSYDVALRNDNRTANARQSEWCFAVMQPIPFAHALVNLSVYGGALNVVAMVPPDDGTSYHTKGTAWKCGNDPYGYLGWEKKDFKKFGNIMFPVDGNVLLRMEGSRCAVTCKDGYAVLTDIPKGYRIAIGMWGCCVKVTSVRSILWDVRGAYLHLVLLALHGRAVVLKEGGEGVLLDSVARRLPWDVVEIIFGWM